MLKKLCVRTRQNLCILNISDIVCCVANERCTDIYIFNDDCCIKTKHCLKKFEHILNGFGFIRCHAKLLVNFDYIKSFDSLNYELLLVNQKTLKVAKGRRKYIMEMIEKNSYSLLHI